MNIHEYQAKEILTKFGVAIPKGGIAYSPENAKDKATELGGDMWVVKAQIHSGARGKAGGIIVCKSHQEVLDAANTLLGKTLVTNQTGPDGLTVQRIYVEEASDIKKEYYLGLVFDRSTESIMVVASSEGGMSIEEIAKEKPESIIRAKVEAAVGMQSFQAREIAFALGLEAKAISRCASAILGCYKAFTTSDATMVEINPLVLTGDDHILALDCKMSFDDNALYRIPQIAELRDKTQEDSKETYAHDRGLNYIALDGDIGNIINGAGLAMASMDMIQLAGGKPANFLDVGGGATPEKFVKAFKLISSDPKVKVILINIFAGINRCDWVAQGIVDALAQITIEQPLVIRLAGTNVDEGMKILKDSNIDYIEASTLEEAANNAVKALKDLENK
ncbi:MAG: malate--CoA ligase subunit beta [Gammaproteobacteria bacterium]|jgi:malate-CoA ligase subunit beta|nr:malate--CoA ligase subunit beta [Gammaproteobacteria bacterium]MBT5406214.1 malate--CoA ligase subunit beta [Gammaproteobacteria bacterium]MBT5862864.1 malate--CoA ligase subunit beta [Gammaproteobacteria bacterium]MBT6734562.1 malate--CoA ligase subunit beta [Gammaproteobacteria bacterium]MBT7236519.1 malate--CoA ligase subunit beta [Gammaproteobacteria bacterium]